MIYNVVVKMGCTPGYGASDEWWVRVTYKNSLLYTATFLSEVEAALVAQEQKGFWLRDFEEDKFAAMIENAPSASPLCDHCGGDTLGGITYCVNKKFCKACRVHIPTYTAAYEKACIESMQALEKKHEEESQKRRKYIADELNHAYPLGACWFAQIKKDGNGAIKLLKIENLQGEFFDAELTIDFDTLNTLYLAARTRVVS